MKKKFIYLKILMFVFILISLLIKKEAFASSLILTPSKNIVGLEEQFYVDLSLNPEGTVINGVEGKMNFNTKEISLVRVEDGKSMVNLWVEKPVQDKEGNITFSGIIPNGFDGVIDPFNPKNKLPGLIARFVFKGLSPGKSKINIPFLNVTLNDGQGTVQEVPTIDNSVEVQNTLNTFSYQNTADLNPELNFEIVKDPNLFNNKYTLVFQAKDKETGIAKVLIKEDKRDWKEIESPYLLEDQSRHSSVSLMAINFSGTSIIKTIDEIPYKFWTPLDTALIVILIIVLLIILKKIYEYRNKK